MATMYPALGLLLRVFIGGYFLYAGIPKIVEPYAFATNITHYELLPAWSINAIALVMPWLEVLLGVCLVLGYKVRTSAVLTAVLLVVFTVAVAVAVMRGLTIDCGCFGDGASEDVSWYKVGKNLLILAGTLYLVWRPRTLLSLDGRREERA